MRNAERFSKPLPPKVYPFVGFGNFKPTKALPEFLETGSAMFHDLACKILRLTNFARLRILEATRKAADA
jgi:hypothetical protein